MIKRLALASLILLWGGTPVFAAEEEAGGGIISINPTLLLYQISLFVLFVILMYFLLYKRLGAFMHKRSEAIAQDLSEAQKARKEAESFREEYLKRINRVEVEVEQIKHQGQLKVAVERENLITAARAEAEQIIAKAKLEIQASRDEAMHQVRDKIADIVQDVVEKILTDTISLEREQALTQKFLAQVGDKWKK